MKRYDFNTAPIRPCKPIESLTGAWVPWTEVKALQDNLERLTGPSMGPRTTYDIILAQHADILQLDLVVGELKAEVDTEVKAHKATKKALREAQRDLKAVKDEGARLIRFFEQQMVMLRAIIGLPKDTQ